VNEKPKVGQTVWFVPSGRWQSAKPMQGRPATVTKVGRKYFECGPSVVLHLDTWREKSESSVVGTAHLSEAHYEAHVRRQRYWNALQRATRMEPRPHENVTERDIRDVAAMLGLKLEVDDAP
jgi:hypothetical protein